MTPLNKYVLDSNVFIESAKNYYAFDIAPKFWLALIEQHENNRLISIERVKEEIDKGKDQLKDWSSENTDIFQSSKELSVVKEFSKIMQWVNDSKHYTRAAKDEFANIADGWLVAYAKAENLKVVTMEVSDPKAKSKVPIPIICREFQVSCCNTFQMLRELNIQFT